VSSRGDNLLLLDVAKAVEQTNERHECGGIAFANLITISPCHVTPRSTYMWSRTETYVFDSAGLYASGRDVAGYPVPHVL